MAPPTSSQRKLRNLLIAKGPQMRLLFPSLALFANMIFLLLALYSVAMKNLAEGDGISMGAQAGLLQHFVVTFGVGFLAMAVLTALMSIVYSHRVFGPKVALMRHIKALNEGNFESRLCLRGNDEFHDMAAALNQLTEKLQAQLKDQSLKTQVQ